MLRESFAIAIDSFRSNKLRSALSLIGVVIGVASVVAVTAIASSGTSYIRKQYAQFSLNAIQVYPGWNPGTGRPAIEFDESLMADIERNVADAKSVLPKTSLGATLSAGRSSAAAQISAVAAAYMSAMGAEIDSGRNFDAVDEYREKPVAILGSELAASLFPEGAPVGKELAALIGKTGFRLEVVGVLKPKDSFIGDDWNRGAYITYAFAKGRISKDTRIETLIALASSNDRSLQLGDELERYFLEKTGNPEAANVISPKKWAESDMKVTGTISMILTGIAAISLLVGGIGIMNIMLVSVTERTREIGIRKALGATPRHIRMQFLVESAALSLAGGIIGLGLGNAIAWLAVKGFKWDYIASPKTALVAFAVSAATGIFFGLYPAARAARLDPAQALASE
jgi:ABC-type antimicrobial peptide transport system, permease component